MMDFVTREDLRLPPLHTIKVRFEKSILPGDSSKALATADVLNLSNGGACIETPMRLSKGDVLNVISEPGGFLPKFFNVRWVDRDGELFKAGCMSMN